MNRRLYRCRNNRVLAGVAGGVAEFFDLDPTLVRVLWFLSIFVGGLGLLMYVGLAIITPLEPMSAASDGKAVVEPDGHRHVTREDGRWTTAFGLVLVLFGTLALVDQFLPALDVEHVLVPVIAIGVGVFLVTRALRREPMES